MAETPTRVTRQRIAVRELLDEVDEFRSAQDLHFLLRERGAKVSLTTVYRTLQSLAETGEVDVMHPPTGEALFRRCSPKRHHHLVCRSCGTTVEIEESVFQAWTDQVRKIADTHRFTEVSHTVEIYGTCPACAA
ncbi:Fur family ferric uptake transcriptional regulator [Thermocatellispora tengchongensis]|uniref:Fur family ferric uptake transcriptional regulator n=1 Tax=Thermocatellispora tengchongensis TaxID=1073253 RepID=A0A840P2F6_9ACTN|nr:transcriptional repressor [Thermocatellispora tengchongensis]MBB5135464.1 Fur family ferric uptake transcriptional regulator [Thermocatellispora tengchongensis]